MVSLARLVLGVIFLATGSTLFLLLRRVGSADVAPKNLPGWYLKPPDVRYRFRSDVELVSTWRGLGSLVVQRMNVVRAYYFCSGALGGTRFCLSDKGRPNRYRMFSAFVPFWEHANTRVFENMAALNLTGAETDIRDAVARAGGKFGPEAQTIRSRIELGLERLMRIKPEEEELLIIEEHLTKASRAFVTTIESKKEEFAAWIIKLQNDCLKRGQACYSLETHRKGVFDTMFDEFELV